MKLLLISLILTLGCNANPISPKHLVNITILHDNKPIKGAAINSANEYKITNEGGKVMWEVNHNELMEFLVYSRGCYGGRSLNKFTKDSKLVINVNFDMVCYELREWEK